MNQFQLIVLLEVLVYTLLPNQAVPIHLCGSELLDALMDVCGERGLYSPPQGYSRRTPDAQSGIATQCCISHCESSLLEKYCNAPATSQSQTAAAPPGITSTTDERKANEIVVDAPDQTGNNGSRWDGARRSDSTVNGTGSRSPPMEVNGGGYGNSGGAAGEEKTDDSNTSEQGESLDDEDEASRDKPTHRPHRGHSKERGKNRTKGSERKSNSSRRRGSTERRTLSSEKREARQWRKEQKLLRRQYNPKRKAKPDKKGGHTVTTPVAVETAEHPFKNGGFNSTSEDLSLVNVTDSDRPAASDTKKDGFFTTITAVLRDVIGFQQADDGNR